MSELTIRKVENGFLITQNDYDYADERCFIAMTDKDMLDQVTKFFFGDHAEWDWVTPASAPEQPKPEGTPASMPTESVRVRSDLQDPMYNLPTETDAELVAKRNAAVQSDDPYFNGSAQPETD